MVSRFIGNQTEYRRIRPHGTASEIQHLNGCGENCNYGRQHCRCLCFSPRPLPSRYLAHDRSNSHLPPRLIQVSRRPVKCVWRISPSFGVLPKIVENGGCEADDVVRLEAVLLPDRKTRIGLSQPATLRCSMAEEIAHWVRDDLVPATRGLGKQLRTIDNYDFYVCRTRNSVLRAKLSEHARANALDVHSFIFTDRSAAILTDSAFSKDFRETVRASACARFRTVLGPGSDSHHDTHVHLDLLDRRNGHRLCQWDVRDPAPEVPLPRPRPAVTSLGQGSSLSMIGN